MRKSMTATTLILATVAALPLLAHEGHKDNSVTTQFSQLDADHNGFISKAETKAQPVLIRYMEVSSYGSFELGDINSDGVLDNAEFLAIEEELPTE